jgi:hypothetical protein
MAGEPARLVAETLVFEPTKAMDSRFSSFQQLACPLAKVRHPLSRKQTWKKTPSLSAYILSSKFYVTSGR